MSMYGSSRDDRDAELRDQDGGRCGVRCDNRVLLRESGAQSDIPPLYAVIRSTSRSEGKPYRHIDAESSLDYIITWFAIEKDFIILLPIIHEHAHSHTHLDNTLEECYLKDSSERYFQASFFSTLILNFISHFSLST